MTTAPSTTDQVLDELEFLAAAEHALIVEYLTVGTRHTCRGQAS